MPCSSTYGVTYGTRFAERVGISPFIVGLTVVAVGTSAPELAVGIQAMSQGQASLVLGNIVGASLVNLLLFLGLVAAIRPVVMDQETLRLDLPAMVVAASQVLLLSLDGAVSRWEGLDPKLVRVDLPAMVGAVLLCVPVFFRGRRITRPEGMLFVTAYAAYLTYSIGLRG